VAYDLCLTKGFVEPLQEIQPLQEEVVVGVPDLNLARLLGCALVDLKSASPIVPLVNHPTCGMDVLQEK